MLENLRKIIATCNISKNAAPPQQFFYHFLYPFQSFFSQFQQVTLVPFKFTHSFIHLMKDPDFGLSSL